MISSINTASRRYTGIPALASGLRSGLLVFTALFLIACAGTGGSGGPGAPTGPLAERAMDRWDALLEPDYDRAYGYYSPGFRSSMSRVDFEIAQRLRQVNIMEAELKEQACVEDVCTLKVKTTYMVKSPLPGIDEYKGYATLEEKWIRTEGEWWYFPDD